jgi:hypothetical protein
MRNKLMVRLAPLLAVAAIAVVPSSASAFQYEHHYCGQNLAPGGTCPPNGSSAWAHLELNEGDAGGQSHETCVDDYLANSKSYTAAKCMYYAGEEARDFPGGEYGYPRAWNGGSVTHWVAATEYGYHTGASPVASPLAAVGAGPGSLPAAAALGLSQIAGVDTSAAVFAGGTYPAWVVPGLTETCVIVGAVRPGDVPGGVCGSTAAAIHGLALATENAAGTSVVLGLVPNGNASVKVTNADGTTENVPVTNNVYEVTGGTPSTVSLKEASGKRVTRHLPVLSRPAPSAPAASATS